MKAIFAINSLGGFGAGNALPWPKSKVDFQRFKDLTTGHTVVMGRSTWDSDMPKPLPNRRNCVLSKTLKDSRCEIFENINSLLMNLNQNEEVFVIGGVQVLWSLRYLINTIYLTRFYSKEKADITINIEQYLQGYQLNPVESLILDDHTFEVYTKIV